MARWAKALIVALAVPCLLFFTICHGLYWYGASALPHALEPTPTQYPREIRQLYWSTLGGERSIAIDRIGPVRYVLKAVSLVADSRYSQSPPIAAAGEQALLQAARLKASDLIGNRRMSTTRRRLAEIALAIRISREWSAEQTIDTILDEQYFGHGARGLEDAARAWFDATPGRLSQHQRLALLTLMRGPSYYHPACRRDRFLVRYGRLLQLAALPPDPGASHALFGMLAGDCGD